MVINGRIKTTQAKAKAIKPDAEKLITKARKENLLAKRLLEKDLIPQAVDKLMKEIAPKFAKRNGGYTRILKLGNRFSDNASTVILEWVEGEEVVVEKEAPKKVVKAKQIKKTAPKKEVKAKSKTVKKGVSKTNAASKK